MLWKNIEKLNQETLNKFRIWIKDAPIQSLNNITPYDFAKDEGVDINESTSFLHSLFIIGIVSIKVNVNCPSCGTRNTIYFDESFNDKECVECEGTIGESQITNGKLIYLLKEKEFKGIVPLQKEVIDPMKLLLKDKPQLFSKVDNVIKMEDYSEVMVEQTIKVKEDKKPQIFIGSSSEALETAYALQTALEYGAEPTAWTQGIFKLSSSTIDDLYKSIKGMDAAIFIFTPDDIAVIRNDKVSVARDNVVFELGLAIGLLGKSNVFYIQPRGSDFHLPTDLTGITPGDYDANRFDGNLQAALGPVAQKILKQIKM